MELWSKDQKILEQHKIEKDWVQWDNNGWQQVQNKSFLDNNRF